MYKRAYVLSESVKNNERCCWETKGRRAGRDLFGGCGSGIFFLGGESPIDGSKEMGKRGAIGPVEGGTASLQ